MLAIRGDRLRERREARRLSQGQLAAFARVGQSYISMIETGKRENVGSRVLTALARVLNTNIDYLAGSTDDPRPASEARIDLSPSKRHAIELIMIMDEAMVRNAERYLQYLLEP